MNAGNSKSEQKDKKDEKSGTGFEAVLPPDPKLRDVIVIAFGLTLGVLLVGGVQGLTNAQQLVENGRWVAHTHEVFGKIEGLLSNLKDAETGQRGYLLTGDQKYLQPYDDALRSMQGIISELDELMSDNPAQQERLDALKPKITELQHQWAQTVELMKGGNRAAAIQIVQSDTGKGLMDDLRHAVATMKDAEQLLLHERAIESKTSYRSTVWAILLTTLIGVGFLILVFVLSQRNIRRRQRVARAYAEQAERLRTTLASIGDAVITTDVAGRITNMNPVAESLTGCQNSEAIGQPLEAVFRIVNEETRKIVANPVTRALQEGVVVGLANHTVLIAKDGSDRPIDDSAAPIRCKEGEIVGCVLVFRDVTERKQVEQLQSERLADAQRLATIVDSSNDAIISKSLEGIIQTWNSAAQGLFGYTAQQAIGRHISLLFPPDRIDEEERIINLLRAGKRIEHYDTVRVRNDGQPVHVSVTISPLRDAEGRIVGASKIVRDITERKEMENKLRRLVAELSDSDRRKDEFLAILAHELRNPLAPIRNGLQLLRVSGDQAANVKDVCSMMERQMSQLVRLIDDLMDVSRITRGKLELRMEQVPVSTVVDSAVEASRPLIEEMGQELTVISPTQPIIVNADPTRLAQALMNLLNNAAKYSERGSHIWLSTERQGDDVVISVKDSGIGIDADQLPRIFEMFRQVHSSLGKSQGGLGIGLTLVKRLIELHGGSIEARSDGPGKGAEFDVRLPMAIDALSPTVVGEGAKRPLKSSFRILVVDDYKDSADTLAKMLRIMGNESRTAYDGQEGIDLAEDFRPEVILLDIGLPKLNGYEVCHQIRELPWGKSIVMIAVTGWGQEEDRRRSQEAGFDHHMVKPVDPEHLMKMLAGLQIPAVE